MGVGLAVVIVRELVGEAFGLWGELRLEAGRNSTDGGKVGKRELYQNWYSLGMYYRPHYVFGISYSSVDRAFGGES